jgi:acyl-coenzyme A thioesterase PaaI-like protein
VEPAASLTAQAPPGDSFYGMTRLPFNRHLGMRFARADSGEAVLSLAARPGGQADGAVYTLGEVAGAIALLDDLGGQPVLMVTDTVTFTSIASTDGELRTRARPRTPSTPGAPRPRKLRLTAEVELLDAEDQQVAEMSVTFNVRSASPELLEGLAAQ